MTEKGKEKPKEEEKPARELTDDEILKKLFPKPVQRLVKGKDPDADDSADSPDDDDDDEPDND